MSALAKIQKGRMTRPRRTVVYGVHGVGKTTWASQWPSPIFLPTEDGASDLDVDRFPVLRSVGEVQEAIISLMTEEGHGYETVVIDSADWMERLIAKAVCDREGKDSLQDFSYGKGAPKVYAAFEKFLSSLDALRNAGMHVLLTAHSEKVKFLNPEGDSYDRYQPKLLDGSSSLLQEWADEVLFATYRTSTRKEDLGFNRQRSIAVGAGERVLKTSEKPSHLAKNRLGLPDELSFDFEEYRSFLPK